MRELFAQPVEEDDRPSDVTVGGSTVMYDVFDKILERRLFVLQGCKGDVGTIKCVDEVLVADLSSRLRSDFPRGSAFGKTSRKCNEPRRGQTKPLFRFFELIFAFERRGCWAREVRRGEMALNVLKFHWDMLCLKYVG